MQASNIEVGEAVMAVLGIEVVAATFKPLLPCCSGFAVPLVLIWSHPPRYVRCWGQGELLSLLNHKGIMVAVTLLSCLTETRI